MQGGREQMEYGTGFSALPVVAVAGRKPGVALQQGCSHGWGTCREKVVSTANNSQFVVQVDEKEPL